MPRKTRTHFNIDSLPKGSLTPKHLTRQQFGNRLWKLTMAKGWRQADLARQSDLAPDSISSYVRGETLPTPVSLEKLAVALGVKAEELLPNNIESAIDEEHPAFELRVSANAPHLAWLRINRLVHTRTALAILDVLEKDNADADGSGAEASLLREQGETAPTDG